MEPQILKGLKGDFLYLQILQELSAERMPQRHRGCRAKELENKSECGARARREEARGEDDDLVAAFTDNVRTIQNWKQLSERTDSEQLYF